MILKLNRDKDDFDHFRARRATETFLSISSSFGVRFVLTHSSSVKSCGSYDICYCKVIPPAFNLDPSFEFSSRVILNGRGLGKPLMSCQWLSQVATVELVTMAVSMTE